MKERYEHRLVLYYKSLNTTQCTILSTVVSIKQTKNLKRRRGCCQNACWVPIWQRSSSLRVVGFFFYVPIRRGAMTIVSSMGEKWRQSLPPLIEHELFFSAGSDINDESQRPLLLLASALTHSQSVCLSVSVCCLVSQLLCQKRESQPADGLSLT